MTKKPQWKIEFDRMKGEVGTEIAALYEEYPVPVVWAVMEESLNRYDMRRYKEDFKDEYESE